MMVNRLKYSYPGNWPWRPIGLRDVEDPILSRQLDHGWRQGSQPYELAALYSPESLSVCF
jgi:hypothetical protein